MPIVVSLDADQNVLPLAWAIVDEKLHQAWTWFFKMLDIHVLSKVTDKICILSDRGPRIISAFNRMPEFMSDRIIHHYCLRYVCSNFNKYFKDQQLKDFVFRVSKEHQFHKLNAMRQNHDAYDYLAKINKKK